ncbi:hypothetical protein P4133_35055 [Pseudomonas aeruginosa]|nr:hypothetical protein [Pseudomonas aeruginosa]
MIVTATAPAHRPDLDDPTGLLPSAGRGSSSSAIGLDWMAFLQDGIEADLLIATGDALALKLVEHARREVADGR